MRTQRKQAHRLAEWLTRDQASLRAVLIGARREGKSDLLTQVHQLLFESAEGPLPFWFRFEPSLTMEASSRTLALSISASFSQQMRAFLLRQQDILAEPPRTLVSELEQPGIPLSLNELGQELLAASQDSAAAGELLALASRLPSRFAHREGRPICLLWDDCHTLNATSPYFSAFNSSFGLDGKASPVCSLLTGFAPWMRGFVGQHAWAAIQLQPFNLTEALMLAESSCKTNGIRFNRQVWEEWFSLAGTSPGWAVPLIEAAAIRGEPLESIEQLGRAYAEELDSGSFGNWLAQRWPLQVSGDRADNELPKDIARRLSGRDIAQIGSSQVELPARASRENTEDAISPLHQNEWIRQRSLAIENLLSPVECDWLRLEADRSTMGGAKARARLLQDFLLRARNSLVTAGHDEDSGYLSLDAIEEHLLFPPTPNAAITTATGDTIRLPKIYTVVRESVKEGEMFWSFGETIQPPTTKKGSAGSPTEIVPMVLLLIHTTASPTKAQVLEWTRRLQREMTRPDEPEDAVVTELWVVVPGGASLAPAANEHRLSRDSLAKLLADVNTAGPAISEQQALHEAGRRNDSPIREIGKRLADLQTRAQLLQKEFRATLNGASPGPKALVTSPEENHIAKRNEYLRQALSLSLMLASADLAATGPGSAAGDREAKQTLAALQVQCQQLLDELRAQDDMDEPSPNSR